MLLQLLMLCTLSLYALRLCLHLLLLLLQLLMLCTSVPLNASDLLARQGPPLCQAYQTEVSLLL